MRPTKEALEAAARHHLGERPDLAERLRSEIGRNLSPLGQEPLQGKTEDAPARVVLATRCMADVMAKPISWLWPGRIARGKLTILAGNPGLGKSQICASIAAIVTTGGQWPVDGSDCPLGSVIFVNAEDDPADTLRPRLEAAGADLRRVHIIDGVQLGLNGNGKSSLRQFNLAEHLDQLGDKLTQIGDVAMVFIDPISAYLGGSTDSHKNSDVRALLAPLSDLAARHSAGILGVSHLSKAGSQQALMRVSGSLAFVAAARAAYLVAEDIKDSARRLFLPLKNNIGPDGDGLAFRIEVATVDSPAGSIQTSRIQWEREAATEKANDVLDVGQRGQGGLTPRLKAEQWLRTALVDGPLMAVTVEDLAADEAISKATLRRAADSLGVAKNKNGMGGGWEWSLPEDAQQP